MSDLGPFRVYVLFFRGVSESEVVLGKGLGIKTFLATSITLSFQENVRLLKILVTEISEHSAHQKRYNNPCLPWKFRCETSKSHNISL